MRKLKEKVSIYHKNLKKASYLKKKQMKKKLNGFKKLLKGWIIKKN